MKPNSAKYYYQAKSAALLAGFLDFQLNRS